MIGTGLPCPSCGTRLQLTIDFIMDHPAAACPTCGCIMKFPRNDKLLEKYKEAKAEIDHYKKQIKKFV